MPNRCRACAHPQLAGLDAMIVAGKTNSQVARTFGISHDSVDRHVRGGHVLGMPAQRWASMPATPASPPKPDASGVEVLREALDALRAMDPRSLSPAAQIDRIDAVRRTAEALAKAEPAPSPAGVRVEDVTGLREQVARWYVALEQYPEARAAMLAATDEALFTAPEAAE
jgi:hypothetical protein